MIYNHLQNRLMSYIKPGAPYYVNILTAKKGHKRPKETNSIKEKGIKTWI